LGIVFYELLTGQLPFKASNEAEILFAIINNEPPKLSKLRDDVPELVGAVVSKMLEKNSELRYQACADVIHDLQGIRKEMETSTVGITGVLGRVQASRKKMLVQRLAAGVVAAAVVTLGIALLITSGTKLDPNKIVVAPFENLTGDSSLDPMGFMVAEMVTDGIERTGSANVYPFRGSRQIYQSLHETEAGVSKTADLSKALAMQTGAGIMISGTIYLPNPETLRFQVTISDMNRDEVLGPADYVDGPRENPEKLIEQLRSKVMGYLASIFDPVVGQFAGTEKPSPSYEAYKEYSEGVELFMSMRYVESIPHFHSATSLDSSYVPPLLWLGYAYWNAGEGFAKADSICEIVSEYREELLPYDKLTLDGLQTLIEGDFETRHRIMKALAELTPASGKSLYVVGYSGIRANYPGEAVEYLNRADPESPILKNWPPYWNQLATALHMLGRHKKELRAVRRGRQQYSDSPRISRSEAFALAALGKVDETKRILNSEFPLPDGAIVWHGAACELREHGHPEAAANVLDILIEWYKARPADEQQANRAMLAWTYYWAERWEEALPIFTELNEEDPTKVNSVLGQLAARRGERDEAMRYIDRLIEVHGMNKYDRGALQYNQACIYSLLGDIEEAVRLLQEAFSRGQPFGLFVLRDIDLEPLRGYPAFEELIRPKG